MKNKIEIEDSDFYSDFGDWTLKKDPSDHSFEKSPLYGYMGDLVVAVEEKKEEKNIFKKIICFFKGHVFQRYHFTADTSYFKSSSLKLKYLKYCKRCGKEHLFEVEIKKEDLKDNKIDIEI